MTLIRVVCVRLIDLKGGNIKENGPKVAILYSRKEKKIQQRLFYSMKYHKLVLTSVERIKCQFYFQFLYPEMAIAKKFLLCLQSNDQRLSFRLKALAPTSLQPIGLHATKHCKNNGLFNQRKCTNVISPKKFFPKYFSVHAYGLSLI